MIYAVTVSVWVCACACACAYVYAYSTDDNICVCRVAAVCEEQGGGLCKASGTGKRSSAAVRLIERPTTPDLTSFASQHSSHHHWDMVAWAAGLASVCTPYAIQHGCTNKIRVLISKCDQQQSKVLHHYTYSCFERSCRIFLSASILCPSLYLFIYLQLVYYFIARR